MNKLEEYKKNQNAAEGNYHSNPELMVRTAYDKGFDAAIALDLPVKFAIWQSLQRDENTGLLKLPYLSMGWKILYQYWINNIYKPE